MVTFKNNLIRVYLSGSEQYIDGIFIDCKNYNGVHAILLADIKNPDLVTKVVPYSSIAYMVLIQILATKDLEPTVTASPEPQTPTQKAILEKISAQYINKSDVSVGTKGPTKPQSQPDDDQLVDFDNTFVNPPMTPMIPVNYANPSDLFDIDIGADPYSTGNPPPQQPYIGTPVPPTYNTYSNGQTPSPYQYETTATLPIPSQPQQIPFIRPK